MLKANDKFWQANDRLVLGEMSAVQRVVWVGLMVVIWSFAMGLLWVASR